MNGLAVSNYVNRQNIVDNTRSVAIASPQDQGHVRVESGSTGDNLSNYINRQSDQSLAASSELGGYVLITRGLPASTGAELARLLDAAERKRDRTYRCYGGRLPRVGTHVILSFRHGVSHKDANAALLAHTEAISTRLRVPIEARIHNKDDRPDHAHMIIGSRVVDGGKLGKKCRALDAVSEKADGNAFVTGGRMLGATIEWMRSDWAARMRDASGDEAVDHRSYARRGLTVVPVTHVPRADIELERRRGSTEWRDRRRRELSERRRASEFNQLDGRLLVPGGMTQEDLAASDSRQAARAAVIQRAESFVEGFAGKKSARREKPDGGGPGAQIIEYLGIDLGIDECEMMLKDFVAKSSAAADALGNEQTLSLGSDIGRNEHALHDRIQLGDSASADSGDVKPQKNSDVNLAIGLFKGLAHARRLSKPRVAQLAEAAGMAVQSFEVIAKAGLQDESIVAIRSGSPALPTQFEHLLATWIDEDNQSRKERRARQVATSVGSEMQQRATESVQSERSPVEQPSVEASQFPAATGPAQDDHPPPIIDHRNASTSRDRPETAAEASAAPAAAYKAGPGAVDGSPLLWRALYNVHAEDIRSRLKGAAYSNVEFDKRVALQLRASGRNRIDVEGILATGRSAEHVGRAVADTFSENATRWLEANLKFQLQARAVGRKAEANLYRDLRRDALMELKRDLSAVWVERRMRADDSATRHAERLRVLLDVRWASRRLRRKGPILAILSVLVELAILQPLIRRQREAAAVDRQALYDAAQAASIELRRLRQDWQSHINLRAADVQRRSQSTTLEPPVRTNEQASLGSSAVGSQDDRRQLVLRYAMLLVAQSAWTLPRAQSVGSLIGIRVDQLRLSAHAAGRAEFGLIPITTIKPTILAGIEEEVRQKAYLLKFRELIQVMDTIRRDQNRQKGREC